jgi:dUTP pyrophosphatase
VAQLVVQRVERATFVLTDELPGSARGLGGHGSTGGLGAAIAATDVHNEGDLP